ncbi:hypothetical protein F0562_013659 [Nyssa sinensis]|uniref:Xyloglucan endotransglucosylase/hydrolase n=1 Tax=Nyssa sinensis TaxID=561372 RepID=A0A5J4ZKQ8_9ASTE|nr:hypothetical protein F0562_013659 [Nyssa sinensis]
MVPAMIRTTTSLMELIMSSPSTKAEMGTLLIRNHYADTNYLFFLIGSGIQSKLSYSSGFFHLRIKLPGKDSGGVVTAFYMTSHKGDELDFEFLGNREGKPYILQTNVFVNGQGSKEQRIHLWFDPTADFHTYRILWNTHQIVFFVNKTPIWVFKNKRQIGVGYSMQPMHIGASVWDGDSWATDGGQTKINWTHAPFKAHFRSFGIDGCPSHNFHKESCYSSKFWWNRPQYWRLSPNEEREYQVVKQRYMIYDYCDDRSRHQKPPPECPQ